MRRLTFMLTFLILLGVGFVNAQSASVSGTVVSSENNQPLPGAKVMIKGTTTGMFTDGVGMFTLKSTSANATLVVSCLGFETKEVIASSNLKIVLTPDVKSLSEIVVTGYGVTSKKAFTGAATTVKGDLVSKKMDANPIKALQGNVPGLQMNLGSGQPGAPTTVFIRGRNSINSGTQPLYVVDGVPIESGTMGIRSDEGQSITPLSTLNADDIESITVLKDATSTSIYGARAANGVIVITTKRGKSGLSINLTAKAGMEMLPNIPKRYLPVNKQKYYELSTEAMLNGHTYGSSLGYTPYFDYYNSNGRYSYDYNGALGFFGNFWCGTDVSASNKADVNWLDEVTRTGLVQNYAIDIRSGGAKATDPKYYFSLDYLDEQAIVVGKDLSRFSLRYNFDHAPSDVVKFGFNTNLSYTTINMGAGGGSYSDPITQAYMQAPNTPVKNADGTWNFATINYYNPVAQRSEYGDKSTAKQYRALFAPYLQVNISKDLFFMSRVGVDAYILDEFGYWSFLQPQGSDMRGMGENSYTASVLTSITNTLNYVKQFGSNDINLMIGQEGQKTHLKESYLAGSNYPVDYLNEVTLASVPSSAATDQEDLILNSFFSRAEYSYNNTYYLSGSFRYDASSRFGANNRWAPFASIGLKYRLSNEDYFKSAAPEWINDLTIRSSYGSSGNQQVGTGWYASRDLYGYGFNYNNIPGSGRTQFGNPDLKWEQTLKFNVGLDFTLLDKITFSGDFYNHQTKDMVFAVPVSRTTGLSSYYKNIGQLSNIGYELAVSADLIKTKDLEWTISVNGSRNVNKVVALSTDDPIVGTYTIIEKGRDLYTFKMKEWAGVDPATGVGLWYKNATGTETTKKYSQAAKRYVGKATPDFQGGLNTSLKWKQFDLGLQINYSIGGKIYGSNLRYDEQYGNSLGNNFTNYVYDNRWKQPGDIAEVPLMMFASGASYHSHSTRFLMDASYVKIQSLSLGYTLSSDMLKPYGIKNARIFVNSDNLYTLSAKNYRGFDPSGVGADGIQWWNYPIPRNIMFGLNVGF